MVDLPPRPAWLQLGASILVQGQRCGIAGIQPTADGRGWLILPFPSIDKGKWFELSEVEFVAAPPKNYRPWPGAVLALLTVLSMSRFASSNEGAKSDTVLSPV